MTSIKRMGDEYYAGAEALVTGHHNSKFVLLYDALRCYLEFIALDRGYKIYNHDCYTSFLKEIVGDSAAADKFDKFRYSRNGLEYYGKRFESEEGQHAIEGIKALIGLIRKKYLGVTTAKV